MAGLEKNAELKKTSFFSRSMTTHHGRPVAACLNPSLNLTTSITKYYTPVESVGSSLKGKVKDLCRLFEGSKSVKPSSTDPPPQKHQKLTKSVLSESRLSPFLSLSNSVTRRLPGTEDRIVVFFTSLRGIRRTYEDCYSVRMIFRGFRVWIDERDVSMDAAYRKELQIAMGEKSSVSLPQVFIMGKYVGGADVIKSLFEIGELALPQCKCVEVLCPLEFVAFKREVHEVGEVCRQRADRTQGAQPVVGERDGDNVRIGF